MNFIEIVEAVEEIENKLEVLSETKLSFVNDLLLEGAHIDIAHYLDYIVEYVNNFSDNEIMVISESTLSSEIMDIIVETSNAYKQMNSFLEVSLTETYNIDVDVVDDDDDDEPSINLLSIVTSALTEHIDEHTVEQIPVEMIFDIVESVKDIELDDKIVTNGTLIDLIEHIQDLLIEYIEDGTIDYDTDDYNSETLSEFLEDYTDTDDLLTEMHSITDTMLNESSNKEASRILGKAKQATVLLERKKERCKPFDNACSAKKGKTAKKYFLKNGGKMPTGHNANDFKVANLKGKLAKKVKEANKKRKKNAGKEYTNDYIQYVLAPAIARKMASKGHHMKDSYKNI